MTYLLPLLIIVSLFSKEYLLFNDSLIIIIVFAIIFAYIVTLATPILKNHIEEVRFNTLNDFATLIKNKSYSRNNQFNLVKLTLEYFYFVDIFMKEHYNTIIQEYNSTIN